LQTHRLAFTYDVHPVNHVVAIQRVVEMVRSPEPDAFIEKARGLINI